MSTRTRRTIETDTLIKSDFAVITIATVEKEIRGLLIAEAEANEDFLRALSQGLSRWSTTCFQLRFSKAVRYDITLRPAVPPIIRKPLLPTLSTVFSSTSAPAVSAQPEPANLAKRPKLNPAATENDTPLLLAQPVDAADDAQPKKDLGSCYTWNMGQPCKLAKSQKKCRFTHRCMVCDAAHTALQHKQLALDGVRKA